MLRIALAVSLTACSSSPRTAGADTASIGTDAADYEGCPGDLPAFVLGLRANGKDDKVGASLLDASPSPPRRYLNVWTLKLTDEHKQPLSDVDITSIRTYMPLHGHAGTPAAAAQMLPDPGEVHADLNFTMRGYWEVQMNVSSPSAGDEYIVFPVCIAQ